MARAELDSEVLDIGSRLYRDAGRHKPALFDSGGVRGRVLKQVLDDAALRNALFQFIDVLPQLERADDVAVHFRSYLAGQRLGGVWDKLLQLGSRPWSAWAVRASVKRMARLFLVEEQPAALLRVLRRLQPLLAEVHRTRAALTIDMEQYELKPLILELFRELVESDPDRGWQPGIALQAYLPETERDLMELIRWARALNRRIGVRLVKGAYWDTEVALTQQRLAA